MREAVLPLRRGCHNEKLRLHIPLCSHSQRTRHQELTEEGVEDPVKRLCEEFCNFPEDSIREIICSDNEILEFEW